MLQRAFELLLDDNMCFVEENKVYCDLFVYNYRNDINWSVNNVLSILLGDLHGLPKTDRVSWFTSIIFSNFAILLINMEPIPGIPA